MKFPKPKQAWSLISPIQRKSGCIAEIVSKQLTPRIILCPFHNRIERENSMHKYNLFQTLKGGRCSSTTNIPYMHEPMFISTKNNLERIE